MTIHCVFLGREGSTKLNKGSEKGYERIKYLGIPKT